MLRSQLEGEHRETEVVPVDDPAGPAQARNQPHHGERGKRRRVLHQQEVRARGSAKSSLESRQVSRQRRRAPALQDAAPRWKRRLRGDPVHGDARKIADRGRQLGAAPTHQIHLGETRERDRLQQHTRAATEIAEHDHRAARLHPCGPIAARLDRRTGCGGRSLLLLSPSRPRVEYPSAVGGGPAGTPSTRERPRRDRSFPARRGDQRVPRPRSRRCRAPARDAIRPRRSSRPRQASPSSHRSRRRHRDLLGHRDSARARVLVRRSGRQPAARARRRARSRAGSRGAVAERRDFPGGRARHSRGRGLGRSSSALARGSSSRSKSRRRCRW